MSSKRPIDTEDNDNDASAPQRKRQRSGFVVGPENLPDGTWKRKVQKIKKDLIQKAKLKKQYAKIKAQESASEQPPHPSDDVEDADDGPEPTQEIHPDRQAMLNAPEDVPPPPVPKESNSQRQGRPRKPAYFEKELSYAEKKKAEAEARRQEWERRDQERRKRLDERERHRRTMAKARSGGRNGQRKLGRESKVLLERVQRLVGQK